MRRGLVKLLNLGYLAACAVSIWSICTKPIFRAAVNIDMTPEKIGKSLEPLLKDKAGDKSTYRVYLREGEEKKEPKIEDFITASEIADSFRSEDPKKNGLHLSVPIAIEAKYAFDLKNEKVISEIVIANINKVIDDACNFVSGPLTNFIFKITEAFAKYALGEAIAGQVKIATGDGSEVDLTTEVTEIYNNIFEILSENEGSVELSELTELIVNGKDTDGDGKGDDGASAVSILNKIDHRVKYEEWDPQPTQSQFDADPSSYFVYVSASDEYINATTYSDSETYYKQIEDPYTEKDLERIDIEGEMQKALESVPGLLDTEVKETKNPVSEEEFNNSLRSTVYYIQKNEVYNVASYGDHTRDLYIKNGSGGSYTLVGTVSESVFNDTLVSNKYKLLNEETGEYVQATHYDENATYYEDVSTIKDIDSALAALINEYLLGKDSSSSEPSGSEEGEGDKSLIRTTASKALTNVQSEEELNKALKEFAYKYIPMKDIGDVEVKFGKYVPMALLGIVILVGFPWALLALITLIRCLRMRKVWTKPWVVFVFAFPQLIFGLMLTYGLKYGLPIAASKIPILKTILDYGISLDLRTLCLVPSFAYLALIIYTIFYAIVAHPLKVQYQFERRMDTLDRHRAQKEARRRV